MFAASVAEVWQHAETVTSDVFIDAPFRSHPALSSVSNFILRCPTLFSRDNVRTQLSSSLSDLTRVLKSSDGATQLSLSLKVLTETELLTSVGAYLGIHVRLSCA